MKVRPSSKFLLLVNKVHGSTRAAAEAWEVQHVSLQRFLNEEGGLTQDTAARIMERTGLAYEDLFVHEEEAAK